ncbi:MAG TPA: DUF4412 domain-containing protein [Candidatus Didemnitutus sp.]|nr:DUF4412 domain-containing protein [Candidatus Didemnitutus sp.]
MNLLTRILCAAAMTVAVAARAADAFEGTLHIAITSDKGQTMNMTQTFKGNAIRIDPDNAPVSMIMDMDKRVMTTLIHERHMYMTRPMPTADEARKMAADGKSPEHDPDIQATGKTEVILGYKCNQYLVKDGDKTTELWLAPDLGVFNGLMQSGGGGGNPFSRGKQTAVEAKWEKVFKGKPGYPLRVVTHKGSGTDFKMEVTKVEKGGVSSAQMMAPSDYQEFKMPAGLGGFFPGGGGR